MLSKIFQNVLSIKGEFIKWQLSLASFNFCYHIPGHWTTELCHCAQHVVQRFVQHSSYICPTVCPTHTLDKCPTRTLYVQRFVQHSSYICPTVCPTHTLDKCPTLCPALFLHMPYSLSNTHFRQMSDTHVICPTHSHFRHMSSMHVICPALCPTHTHTL